MICVWCDAARDVIERLGVTEEQAASLCIMHANKLAGLRRERRRLLTVDELGLTDMLLKRLEKAQDELRDAATVDRVSAALAGLMSTLQGAAFLQAIVDRPPLPVRPSGD